MNPAKFKILRQKLGLTQEETAILLGLAGKKVVSNIETQVRSPSALAMAVMEILNELPPKKSQELMELLKKHLNHLQKDDVD